MIAIIVFALGEIVTIVFALGEIIDQERAQRQTLSTFSGEKKYLRNHRIRSKISEYFKK